MRRITIARTSDFQPNGLLRAVTLNDELDRQVAGLQELRDEIGSGLRAGLDEAPAGLVIPPRAARADRLLRGEQDRFDELLAPVSDAPDAAGRLRAAVAALAAARRTA